jgi:hypothetical protein
MPQTESQNTPPLLPPVPAPKYPLMADESPDILVDVAVVVPNWDHWLDAPNTRFGLATPRSLIGTEREIRLREVLRSIKYGLYS